MPNSNSLAQHLSSSSRLTRSLSAQETWGFGLTGHILWIAVIPAIHAALGVQAIFVWIPAVLFGMLLNYQVKRLGTHYINVAGGTPNYGTKLLNYYPGLARYGAVGYFFSWVSVVPVNAIILTDLIEVNLEGLSIACPKLPLELGFTLLPFVLAFSGTRALSILHLFFVIPAFGLLLIFCVQGLGWLAFSPVSPGFFPQSWLLPGFGDWAKWFLYVTFATYACETSSSFVADSRSPDKTLLFLSVAAWMMLPIYLGGSWVVMRLATDANLKDSAFLNLLAAAKLFWGDDSALIITFLLTASCLLACATTVSNCPRIIYQLALDKYLSPVFAVVSRRGVFGPALTLTLALSLVCLIWGNVADIVVVGNVGLLISIMAVHLGMWLQRNRQEVLLPRITLGILLLEVAVLLVGGLAWGWQNFLIGLLLPIGIIGIDAAIRRLRFAPLRPGWWIRQYSKRPVLIIQDSVMLQVIILILLLCGAVLVGWLFGVELSKPNVVGGENLVVVLLMTVVFVGVAIACWTSLPQVVAIAEAREASEAQLHEKSQQLAAQLVQSEKMSSLGSFVAGVAHEINNPVSFIYGNLTYADEYTQDLLKLLQLYQQCYPHPTSEIQTIIKEIDLNFLMEDLPKLLNSMKVGAERITEIVRSLRNFSRLDESEMKAVDIHEGIDSTLLILQHRLLAKPGFPEIQIIKEYGNLPLVECFAGQLNQVFINILANAIDALEEGVGYGVWETPQIRIRTELTTNKHVIIRIADNGSGIPETVQKRLFDPFFTTKPVGKGTGLGLSISYQIVAEKHKGKLQCISSPGEGAEFVIIIPQIQKS